MCDESSWESHSDSDKSDDEVDTKRFRLQINENFDKQVDGTTTQKV
jgi:hypothetical protein